MLQVSFSFLFYETFLSFTKENATAFSFNDLPLDVLCVSFYRLLGYVLLTALPIYLLAAIHTCIL
jgi:hypothetical protein